MAIGSILAVLGGPGGRLVRLVPPRAAAQRRERRRPRALPARPPDPAVPEVVVPGLKFRESYLGLALAELSHVENLPQRVPIVLAAGFIAASAIATGPRSSGGSGSGRGSSRWERLAVGFGLGTTGLGLATLIVGRLGCSPPGRSGSGWRCRSWPRSSAGDRRATGRSADPTGRARRPVSGRSVGFGLVAGPFLLDHGPGGDAADGRLRRDRIPPPGAQGILPGRADRVPAAQRLHEHAVRHRDAPPAGHGGRRRLVARGAGRAVAGRPVRAGGGRR